MVMAPLLHTTVATGVAAISGNGSTINVKLDDATRPQSLLASTWYVPASPSCVLVNMIVLVPWPDNVDPVACNPFTNGVAPLYQIIVGAGVPVIVEVNVVVLSSHFTWLGGVVTVGLVYTTRSAVETSSPLGMLSTFAWINAVPPVPFDVNVAVASPSACIDNSWPDNEPSVADQVTGKPISLEIFASV